MKIQNSGSSKPIELNQVKAQKEAQSTKAAHSSRSGDQVSAKLSTALRDVTEAIQNSGLTAGELHSNVNESRAMGLLDSFDRVEEKAAPVEADKALQFANDLAEKMIAEPQAAANAFSNISRNRVEELLS